MNKKTNITITMRTEIIKRFKPALFFVIGLTVCQTLVSQENFIPGYVIKNYNDTLHGRIDYRNWRKNPDLVLFKKEGESFPAIFDPTEITEFHVEDDIYVSAVVELEVSPTQLNKLSTNPSPDLITDTTFLQVLYRGEKSLYFHKNKEGQENFFIKNDSEFELLVYKKYAAQVNYKNVMVEYNKYKGQLSLYLNECEGIASRLKSTSYNPKSLMNLFHEYYECAPSELSFKKQIDRLKAETGILAGASLTILNFSGRGALANSEYDPSANFSAGLFLDVIFPRNFGKWSVYNELLLVSYKVSDSFKEVFNEDRYTVTTTELGYSYLKLNNLLRYKHPVGKWYLFVNGGVSNGYAVSETNYKKIETKLYTSEKVEEEKALDDPRKYIQNLLLGAGVKSGKLSFELRHEKGAGMSKNSYLSSKINRYYFLIGFIF